MRRHFRLGLTVLPISLTFVAVLWFTSQSPFTAPVVERSAAEVRAVLLRATARTVDLAWLLPRVQRALIEEDLAQLDLLFGLANDHGVALPIEMVEDAARLNEAASGLIATATACGACAWDITACDTVATFTACGLSIELTPAGDLNAIRRGAVAYVAGEDVDRLDLGLGIVGLGATGAVLATGGTSYTVKIGATFLRLAKRLGTLTPALARRATMLLGDAVRWDRMGDLARLQARPADLINAAQLSELAALGRSLDAVRTSTSTADALRLVRHVDNVDDAARLARVSDAMGAQTRATFEVLGKARVFRATLRVSDLAFGAAAALYAFVMQVAVFAAQQGGALLLRALRRLI